MDLRCAVRYLNYRLRETAESELYRAVTAQSLAILASGRNTKTVIDYPSLVAELYGVQKRDERTAEQIILDTAKKFGVKVR